MKIKIISIFLIIVLLSFIFIPTSNALVTGNDLIKINGKTITKTTTIEQVNSMFGNPKIETESAFGGKGYSYYDDNYSYYLFLETNADGNIMSYGGIGGNFEAREYADGGIDDGYFWNLSGTVLSDFDTNIIYGALEYNCNSNEVATYWENYEKDSSTYLYGLQKHSIAVSKVLAKRNGDEFPQTYADEEVFYISEQLKYNESSLYDYAKNTGKTQAIYSIGTRNKIFDSELPNPIYLGSQTENYSRPESFKYMMYDIDVTDYESSWRRANIAYMFINPSFLDEREEIELTEEEKSRLASAKEQYQQYIEKHGLVGSNILIEDCVYKETPLVAGKYNPLALESTTNYLNIARVGLGLTPLKLDEELADCAQHKAVLVYYNNYKGYESGHFPEQPEGVSDEFYNKAQTCMNENLYTGDILGSIYHAINDGYGDPIECGHRYNLLDPYYTKWGVGSIGEGLSFGYQAAQKFYGNGSFNGELVAWPSNGIMPIDYIASTGIGNWTARFYKNYTITDDTEVTIKCLNTGEIYEITKENCNDDGKFLKKTGSRLLTFRDDNFSYENGDVFQITLHNIKNDSTGNIEDYTYRSVFYNFGKSSDIEEVTDIELNKTSINLNMGSSLRVFAKVVPDTASNKLMIFKSKNENIAKVRQDGTITGLNPGTTTITVKCGSAIKNISVTVEEFLRGDINNDGKITIADLNYGLKRLTGIPLTEDEK